MAFDPTTARKGRGNKDSVIVTVALVELAGSVCDFVGVDVVVTNGEYVRFVDGLRVA